MSSIPRNIAANYVGRIWGVVSVYLFIPVYLNFLGIEAFGLIGFYSTLAGVLAFADMGLTATLNRETARLSAHPGRFREVREALRTYETIYLGLVCAVGASVWAMAPMIAERWLQSRALEPQEVSAVVRVMAISLGLQLLSGLFIGGLLGLQRQVLANGLQIVWSLIRGVGTTLVLWLVSPTILAFAFWQLVSNAIYLFMSRASLWRALSESNCNARAPFNWQVLRGTWRYAAGMIGMTAISTLLTQTDKLAVSKMLPLEMLGYYTLAAVLAAVTGNLAGPIVRAVFPRLTTCVELSDREGLVHLYHRTSQFVALAIVPGGVTVAAFSGELIYAWTGSVNAAANAGPVASLLTAGALMQSLTVVPYYVALAHGDVRLNLLIGVGSILVLIPLLAVLVPEYGVLGAGGGWLVMNIIMFLPYLYFIHRRFLAGEFRKWARFALMQPLLLSLPWVLLGRLIMPQFESRGAILLWVGITCGLALVGTAMGIPGIRSRIKKSYDLSGAPYAR